MALWIARSTKEGTYRLEFTNFATGKTFCCGESEPGLSERGLLAWIVTEGDPGDLIVLDGALFQFLPREQRA